LKAEVHSAESRNQRTLKSQAKALARSPGRAVYQDRFVAGDILF